MKHSAPADQTKVAAGVGLASILLLIVVACSIFGAGTKKIQAPVWVEPSVPTESAEPLPSIDLDDAESTRTYFRNCVEMRKVYPNGVKKGHPAYRIARDRNRDGWACER